MTSSFVCAGWKLLRRMAQGTLLPGGRVWLATEEDNRQQLDWTAAEIVKVINADRVVVRYMEPPTAPHRPPTAVRTHAYSPPALI